MDRQERDEMILKHAPLVRNVVKRLAFKLPIDRADREDLVQVGIMGLMEALDKFDGNRNVRFETYATFRIRGAVLDELRSRDRVPRSVRYKDSKLEAALTKLQKELGRPPVETEVADHLGLSLEQYYKLLDDTKAIPLISKEDLTPDYVELHSAMEVMQSIEQGNPLDLLTSEEMKSRLKQAIRELPEKERLVVSLYYDDEMTMKEIGKILGLTESRVCQLHTQAMLRLRGAVRTAGF